jgi:zinc/manganese transport system permease protein
MNEPEAERQGLNIRWWDFLFYMSFGFVVTSSVAIAGVLLVFCFLIVPSVTAMLFAERLGPRLAIGWTMGAVVSALGVWFSFQLDLPTGAAIVGTFGAALLILSAVRLLVRGRPGTVPT